MSSFFVCYASSTFRRALTRMSQLCLFRGGNRWEVLSPKMYPQSNAILSSQNFLDSHVLWYLLPFSLRFWGWNAGNVSGACCLWQGLSVVHMTTTTAIQKKTPWPHRCVFTGSPFNLSTTQMNPIHYTYDQGRPKDCWTLEPLSLWSLALLQTHVLARFDLTHQGFSFHDNRVWRCAKLMTYLFTIIYYCTFSVVGGQLSDHQWFYDWFHNFAWYLQLRTEMGWWSRSQRGKGSDCLSLNGDDGHLMSPKPSWRCSGLL